MPISALLEQLQAEDLTLRDQAATELAAIAREGLGAPLLLDALGTKHGRVRREAAKALGVMGQRDESIIAGLCGLLHERSDKLKRSAAKALARLGRPAIQPLIAALPGASDYSVCHIAWALGQLRDKAAQEALTTIFWEQSNKPAQAAARALAHIDFQAALHSFSEAARGWDMSHESTKAHMGLLQLGIAAPDPIDIIDATVMGGDSLTAFEISQGKGNRQVLLGAIRGLGERRDPRGIPVLLDALEYNVIEVRLEAATALRRLQGPTVRESVLRILQDTQLPEGPRVSAVQLLSQLRERRALPAFLTCLVDPSTHVNLRVAAARAYQRFQDPNLLSDLLQALATVALEEDDLFNQSTTCTWLLDSITFLANKRIPEEQRFAYLREALSHPTSDYNKQAIDKLLAAWPDDENKELAVAYVGQHLGV